MQVRDESWSHYVQYATQQTIQIVTQSTKTCNPFQDRKSKEGEGISDSGKVRDGSGVAEADTSKLKHRFLIVGVQVQGRVFPECCSKEGGR